MLRHSKSDLINNGAPGDWFIDLGRRIIILAVASPDFKRIFITLNIMTVEMANDKDPCWTWNGSFDKPSLIPVIDMPGIWKGWLRNGELEN